jgi:hypothetical protein
MAALYSRAKIGFHYIECTSPLRDMVSMRVYEVLAAGTLLLASDLGPGVYDALGLQARSASIRSSKRVGPPPAAYLSPWRSRA